MINWFLNLSFTLQISFSFVIGLVFGILLMILLINIKNKKINVYKRQLEK